MTLILYVNLTISNGTLDSLSSPSSSDSMNKSESGELVTVTDSSDYWYAKLTFDLLL